MSTQKNPEIIDLNKLVGIILDSKKSIAASTLLCASMGVGYAILSTPVYKADALIQVEEKASGMAALGEMSEMFATEGRSSTEIELLKSRMVLGETVDKLGLTTVVTPKTLPVIGAGIDRLSGVNKFANLSTFDAPVGKYRLIIERNTASLYNEFNQLILAGRVGEAMTNTDADISMKIESASIDGEFAVTKVTRRQAINDLKQSFSVSELGKQTGMLSLSVTGHNKAHLENVLNTISNSYVNQNIERNAQEAKNSLAFLQKHMPTVKETLTIAENKLNAYRLENDSVDLGLEAKSTLDVIVGIEQQLNELTFKESEISQRFTQSHPSYVALIEKRQTLLSERDRFNKMIQKLPKTQREVLRLTRDVEVNQSIYLSMLNKVQELSVVQASTVGNVRLVDEANAIDEAVKPKEALIALASALFGFLFGSGIALVRSIMNKGITSPEELDQISMPVYATVPLSEEQSKLEKQKR